MGSSQVHAAITSVCVEKLSDTVAFVEKQIEEAAVAGELTTVLVFTLLNSVSQASTENSTGSEMKKVVEKIGLSLAEGKPDGIAVSVNTTGLNMTVLNTGGSGFTFPAAEVTGVSFKAKIATSSNKGATFVLLSYGNRNSILRRKSLVGEICYQFQSTMLAE